MIFQPKRKCRSTGKICDIQKGLDLDPKDRAFVMEPICSECERISGTKMRFKY